MPSYPRGLLGTMTPYPAKYHWVALMYKWLAHASVQGSFYFQKRAPKPVAF